MTRRLIVGVVFATLLAAAGCSGSPDDPSAIVVARVDGRKLTLSDLERYFQFNLLEYGSGEALPPEEAAEVKSRLFDAFVDEYMLLAEAEEAGIEASAEEVLIYLGAAGEEDEPRPDNLEARAEEARRRIKIEKLQEQALSEQPGIADAEVRDHVRAERPRLTPSRRVELRALMLPTIELAEKVHRDLRKRRMTFDEAVVAHEAAPGQGLPMRMDWENLSPPAQEALDGLKPGQVSAPVEVHGEIYIFRIESWLKDPARVEQELERLSRGELEARRRMRAYDELLERVRARRKVRRHPGNLPFPYVPSSVDSR